MEETAARKIKHQRIEVAKKIAEKQTDLEGLCYDHASSGGPETGLKMEKARDEIERLRRQMESLDSAAGHAEKIDAKKAFEEVLLKKKAVVEETEVLLKARKESIETILGQIKALGISYSEFLKANEAVERAIVSSGLGDFRRRAIETLGSVATVQKILCDGIAIAGLDEVTRFMKTARHTDYDHKPLNLNAIVGSTHFDCLAELKKGLESAVEVAS